MIRRSSCFLACALVFVLAGPASAKRPLTHADYASWRSIQGAKLSADGAWVAYALVPQEGDGELVVRHLKSSKEWRAPRGYRAPLLTAPARATPGAAAVRGSLPAFTPDGKTVVFPIYPTKAEADKARKSKTPVPAPRQALGILDLATGKVARIGSVGNFQVPEEGPSILAYHIEPRAVTKPGAKEAPNRPKAPAPKRTYGTDLVVRTPADGKERTFAGVTEFTLSKDGRYLVYAISSRQEETNGVYAVVPGGSDAPIPLRTGPGRYSRLTWDDKQTQLAFLHEPPAQAPARLYHWARSAARSVRLPLFPSGAAPFSPLTELTIAQATAPAATELVAPRTALRPGWQISGHGELAFSLDGARVFFGVVPPKAVPKVADTDDEDKVAVELWHWQDDFIQPMQKVRAERERQRTYRAVFDLKDRSCRQLADLSLEEIFVAPAGDWALGADDRPHRLLVGQDTVYADYYLVSLRAGGRKPLLKKHNGPVTWSPGGRYLLYHDGKDWLTLTTPTGKASNLTGKLAVKFVREDDDHPSPPPPYGVAGWTADDKHVLLYDRYDIWMIAADGTEARNLTHGMGRKTRTQLRRVVLNPRERGVPADASLLLRGENEETRDTGFWRVGLAGGEPTHLLSGPRHYGVPVRARNADVLLLTVSTFYDYPDLSVTDSTFRKGRKVSNANPHKADLLWGKAELVRFKSADGVPLSGVLIKPENFDPNKKYPLMVYIYERLSDRLHRFVEPRPETSINATFYASNGYLVFMPDIVYTVGYPGKSALKCVLPGVQAVVDKGFVDEKAIGIQGHSWGGYQVAYLITQTTRFKAASAGAPVSNMTSAYGGIRWGSGLPRQFQYEKTQSRIGGSLWQYPMRFLENSPLFQADRVQTPLLMLHNDRDEAVPWYQGIEYYLALRRLGKEAYMFNYIGEAHGLRRRANQKDYTVRLQQFFDHHLKGAPKPAWMERGAPHPAPVERAPAP